MKILSLYADSARVTQTYSHRNIPNDGWVATGDAFFTVFAAGPKLYLRKQTPMDKMGRAQVQLTENP